MHISAPAQRFRLHAVVEAPLSVPSFVTGVPDAPSPRYIRLSGSTPTSHAALLVAMLAQYGHRGKNPSSMRELLHAFPSVLPGGLMADGDSLEIYPSCCCGFEKWREWQYLLLSDRASPWMGHDPTPWVQHRNDGFVVWSDSASDAMSTSVQSFSISRAQLSDALRDVEQDIRDFVGVLELWASQHAPYAKKLATRFEQCFVAEPAKRRRLAARKG